MSIDRDLNGSIAQISTFYLEDREMSVANIKSYKYKLSVFGLNAWGEIGFPRMK